jgi:hypothetical protein
MHAFELDACAMRAGCAGDPALGYELRQFSVSAGGAGTDPLGTAGLTRTRNAGSTYAVRACGNGAEVQFGDRGEIISELGHPQQHISERCGVYRRRFSWPDSSGAASAAWASSPASVSGGSRAA